MEAALQNTNGERVILCPSPQRAARHTWAAARSSPPKIPRKETTAFKANAHFAGDAENFEGSIFFSFDNNPNTFVENSRKG